MEVLLKTHKKHSLYTRGVSGVDEQNKNLDAQQVVEQNNDKQHVSDEELAKALDNVVERVMGEVHRQQEKDQSGIGFLRNMMSMDEARVSALMISLLVSLGFGGYAYLQFGDVSERWTSLIETFAYCVTGINMLATINPKSRLAKVVSNLTEQAEIATQPKTQQQQEQPAPAPTQAPAPTPTPAPAPAPAPVPAPAPMPAPESVQPVQHEPEVVHEPDLGPVQFRAQAQPEFHVVDSKKS